MIKAELIDHLGSDLTVVNAARVSFDKESEFEYESAGDDPCEIYEKDKRLISYLARHNHFTPFTHAMITLRETVPIFVARQRMKHMIGFTYNEVSRRYVDTPPEFFMHDVWRERAENKKQGSGNGVVEVKYENGEYGSLEADLEVLMEMQKAVYQKLLDANVAPEQARMILPQSMMTSYYVTGSLAAFARAYKLRIAEDSQYEIQLLAKQWDEIIRPLYPESWARLTE